MKFIYDYLKVKAETAHQTADLLTLHTQEVERVHVSGVAARGVITGKISDIQSHPSAERLRIVSVDIASEIIDIITAASNIEIGQIVPVALPGSTVIAVDHGNPHATIDPNVLITIEERNMRGITSHGMLCGADELGLSDRAEDGIYVFPLDTKIGVPVEQVIPSSAVIEMDDKGTAHRPDLLSYRGVEIELGAILQKPVQRDVPTLQAPQRELQLSITADKACSTFIAATLTHFKTMESPIWLQQFLRDHDIKVVNLPTDATNYIMLTEGGSTHAFGAESISGALTVRYAKAGETVEGLNNKKYTLSTADLVIADSTRALDIAGIIGDRSTGVTEGSKEIILTSIVVDSAVVRRTSRRLTLRTDASMRRERGQSIAASINAFNKVIEIVQREGGATINGLNYVGSTDIPSSEVLVGLDTLNQFLNLSLSTTQISDILHRLGYKVDKNGNQLSIKVPWWRSDVHTAADAYEDIARIFGYDRVPSLLPQFGYGEPPKQHLIVQLLRKAAAEQLFEVQTSSMVEHGDAASTTIQNPIGNRRYIRQTLLPKLFELTEQQTRAGYEAFGCFEIGNTYRRDPEVQQKVRFGLCLAGDPEHAKSVLGLLLHRLHINTTKIRFVHCPQTEDRNFRYDAVAKILYDDTLLGNLCVNKQHGHTLSGIKLKIEVLTELANLHPYYQGYSHFPSVKRDIAFVIDQSKELGNVVADIQKHSDLITGVVMFDRFSGGDVAPTEQSVAFHLIFQSSSRTLTDAEVNEIMKAIEADLTTKYQVTIRE